MFIEKKYSYFKYFLVLFLLLFDFKLFSLDYKSLDVIPYISTNKICSSAQNIWQNTESFGFKAVTPFKIIEFIALFDYANFKIKSKNIKEANFKLFKIGGGVSKCIKYNDFFLRTEFLIINNILLADYKISHNELEQELGGQVSCSVGYEISSKLKSLLFISYDNIFLYKDFSTIAFGIGLGYSFSIPKSLRSVLQ